MQQEIVNLKNGATLVYDHCDIDNTTYLSVAFKSGSQCDGEDTGLAHFVEHMLIDVSENNKCGSVIRSKALDFNASTYSNFINTSFYMVSSKLGDVLEAFANGVNKTYYSEKEINNEKNIIYREIDASNRENSEESSFAFYFEIPDIDVLGTEETLSRITSHKITNFKRKYFTTQNTVVYVQSNLPLEQVTQLVQNNLVDQIPSVAGSEVTASSTTPIALKPSQYLLSNTGDKSVIIEMFFPMMMNGKQANIQDKEESLKLHLIREFQYYLFNQQELLFKKLRQENTVAYHTEYIWESDYFPKNVFHVSTNQANTNKTIKLVVDIVSKLVNNGISENTFRDFVDNMSDIISVDFKKYQNINGVGELLEDFISDNPIVQRDEVLEMVKNMSVNQFNDVLKDSYKKAPVYIVIDGDLDSEHLINVDLLTARINYKDYTVEQLKQIPKFATPEQKTDVLDLDFDFGEEIEFEPDVETNDCRKIIHKKMFSSDDMLQATVDEVTEYLDTQGFVIVDEACEPTLEEVSEKLLNLKMAKKEKDIESLNEEYANFLHLVDVVKQGEEIITKQKYKLSMLKSLSGINRNLAEISRKVANDQEIIKTKKGRNPLHIERESTKELEK